MTRFRTVLLAGVITIGLGIMPLTAQTTAKQDAKSAGHSTKTAVKKTGSAVKKGIPGCVHLAHAAFICSFVSPAFFIARTCSSVHPAAVNGLAWLDPPESR